MRPLDCCVLKSTSLTLCHWLRYPYYILSDMEIIDFVLRPDQFVYTFGGAAPAATIEPGTALRLWSEDAFNNAITTRSDVPSSKLDPHRLNPQTGPFYVNGAEPGDA